MSKLDSHQIVGLFVIVGVLAGLTGLVFQRLDLAIMAGAVAFIVSLLVGPPGRGGSGAGDSGPYDGDGGGGCGGGD